MNRRKSIRDVLTRVLHAVLVEAAAEQITWNVRDLGFDMVPSGAVPGTIGEALRASVPRVQSGTDECLVRLAYAPKRAPRLSALSEPDGECCNRGSSCRS